MNKFNSYYNAVNYLESLRVHKVYMKDSNYPELYLKRMRYFLKMLDNPDRGLEYIHVTGTAGKGTVSTIIQQALKNSKQGPVGLLTSPFVSSKIEEIKVDDHLISPALFVKYVTKLRPLIKKAQQRSPYGGPSSYETLFAIALLYFQEMKCKWVVLEVFAGGRYDATNVIRQSRVSVITNIDYDHQEAFGPTLRKIAWEKEGIIKSNSIFWTSERRPWILRMFKETCLEQHTEFKHIDSRKITDEKANIVLASAVCSSLGLPQSAIEEASSSIRLPARFELMRGNKKVVLDGAHNVRKIKFLANKLKKFPHRKLILIISILASKKFKEMLEIIVPHADQIIITSFDKPHRPAVSPEILFDAAFRNKRKNASIRIVKNPQEALQQTFKQVGKKDLILATGSFFLAGELRKLWYPERLILTKRQSF
jgi:dihydrofolate synthase/folylpolyglutamate synthase